MTTEAAAREYLAKHLRSLVGKGYAVYNPLNKELTELPVIYGFSNGGSAGWLAADLIAEDGTYLGGHICSHEGYMPSDLGVLEGTGKDKHEDFKKHYPNGYRMEFVGLEQIRAKTNVGFEAALVKAIEKTKGGEE